MLNSEPKLPLKGKLQFGKHREPLDHYSDRRVADRRILVVNTTKRLVHFLLLFIFFLAIGIGVTGIVVYSRFEDLNRKLMVEDLSVPPIDIAIDQPIDPVEVEEPLLGRRRR